MGTAPMNTTNNINQPKSGVLSIDRRNQLLDQSQLKLDNSSETDLSDYRSRLSTMEANDLRNKLASERQTSLVQKLQAKVLQYKRKCTDLEQSVADANLSYEKSRNRLQEDLAKLQQKLDQSNDKIRNVNAQHDVDINDIVDRLEREQKKNVGLQEVNSMLREETDALQNDNIKLKEKLKLKQDDYLGLEEQVSK